MTAALALNRDATWPAGKRFRKAENSATQSDLHSSKLRLNKKCFNQALFGTGLLLVTKSDNAESTYQRTQTGYRQNLRFGLYSALRATRHLEHYAELGIMFHCSPTPK
jgi:hypothetical protein